MVSVQNRRVWFSPAKGRAYLTRRAAIRNEAHALIMRRYPKESPDYHMGIQVYGGWSLKYDEPERYNKMLRRLMKLIDKKSPR